MKKYRVRCNFDEIIEAEDNNDAWIQFRNSEDLDLKVEELN